MKKTIALLLALVMMFALCACGQSAAPAATEAPAAEPAADAEPARPHFDKLTLEFVPSKDADVIITGTKDLPELVKAEMANLGYDIDEVDITVGTSYDATGEAMSAGSIDLGWPMMLTSSSPLPATACPTTAPTPPLGTAKPTPPRRTVLRSPTTAP